MTAYFGDTFYFLAILNPSDGAHARARPIAATRAALTEALTGDHHFEQAGFVALLK